MGDTTLFNILRAIARGSGALLRRLRLPAQIFFSFLPSSVPLTPAAPLHTLQGKRGVNRITGCTRLSPPPVPQAARESGWSDSSASLPGEAWLLSWALQAPSSEPLHLLLLCVEHAFSTHPRDWFPHLLRSWFRCYLLREGSCISQGGLGYAT